MEDKNKNFLPSISEPVMRQKLGINLNQEEDLTEEELTGNLGMYQGGINPSTLPLGQCVLALCSPFAGDDAD